MLSQILKNTVNIALLFSLNACASGSLLLNRDDFPKLVLQESFTSPSKFWGLPPGTAMKNGGLFRKEPTKKTLRSSLWYGHNFKEVDFSSNVSKISGPDDVEFGLIARYQNGNFYYLLIKGEGQFALGKYSENKGWEDKLSWQESSAIKQRKNQNRLRIVCNEKMVMGWVNDRKVGEFEDSSYTYGQIGLASARGSGEAVAVYFDNVLAKEKPKTKKVKEKS